MIKIISFLFLIFNSFILIGQCSTVAVQISSSDTANVQLYHAGFFNIPSGFENVCVWEVRDFNDEIIHQDTTTGSFSDQSTSLFNHEVSIQDSMKATIVITNEAEGIICTMNDTLFWEEQEVLPGSFIGFWSVLSSNGGVEEEIITSLKSVEGNSDLDVVPTLVHDVLWIEGNNGIYSLNILNANGQLLMSHTNVGIQDKIEVSHLLKGVYFVQILDQNSRKLNKIKKIVKM